MRLSRLFFGGGLLTCILLTVAGGCQDPTQMTLVISLDPRARCEEIASGVAITVGADPVMTESYVAQGYVHARTASCDVVTGHVGTLVITPSDAAKGAVVVVAGYQGNDPTNCRPPSYTGCIVARRRFTFLERTRLRMPISIDPDCRNVPCDAFSTCSRGRCVDSATVCTEGVCEVAGTLADGGIDDGSSLPSDSGDRRDDASTDAPGLEDASPGTSCIGNPSWCGGEQCGPGRVCCNGTCQTSCTGNRICCTNADCGGNDTCVKEAGVDGLGVCTTGPVPQCNPGLTCGGQACNGNACCSDSPSACFTGNTCPRVANNQYCCVRDDCPTGYACSRDPLKNTPGLCFPEPRCEGLNLVCNGGVCPTGYFCCTTDPPGTSCRNVPACSVPTNQYCCKNEDCPTGYECNNAPGALSTCKPKNPGQQGPGCNGNMDLFCGGEVCSTTNKKACCYSSGYTCSFGCTEGDQLCCKDAECPSEMRCERPGPVGDTGICRRQTMGPACNGNMDLVCGGQVCSTTSKKACCQSQSTVCSSSCGPGDQLCCKDSECPPGQFCYLGAPGATGICQNPPPPPQEPFCNGNRDLVCGGQVCSATSTKACCRSTKVCSNACAVGDQLCCKDPECPPGHACFLAGPGGTGICNSVVPPR